MFSAATRIAVPRDNTLGLCRLFLGAESAVGYRSTLTLLPRSISVTIEPIRRLFHVDSNKAIDETFELTAKVDLTAKVNLTAK